MRSTLHCHILCLGSCGCKTHSRPMSQQHSSRNTIGGICSNLNSRAVNLERYSAKQQALTGDPGMLTGPQDLIYDPVRASTVAMCGKLLFWGRRSHKLNAQTSNGENTSSELHSTNRRFARPDLTTLAQRVGSVARRGAVLYVWAIGMFAAWELSRTSACQNNSNC